MTDKAVILLSGGLDSAATLAIAKTQGFELYALTVDYGQRHRWEITCARTQAKARKAALHKIIAIELPDRQASALTGSEPIPQAQFETPGIPATYVPARNTILLALALSWAEAIGAYDIFIGVNAVDYNGYPDCRPAFIQAFENLANLATKAATQNKQKFRLHAPLLDLTKHQIIQRGRDLGVDFAVTSSCYDVDEQGQACGRCDSCALRLKGFRQAGLTDPIRYA